MPEIGLEYGDVGDVLVEHRYAAYCGVTVVSLDLGVFLGVVDVDGFLFAHGDLAGDVGDDAGALSLVAVEAYLDSVSPGLLQVVTHGRLVTQSGLSVVATDVLAQVTSLLGASVGSDGRGASLASMTVAGVVNSPTFVSLTIVGLKSTSSLSSIIIDGGLTAQDRALASADVSATSLGSASFLAATVEGGNGVYIFVDGIDTILGNTGGTVDVKITISYSRGSERLAETVTVQTDDDAANDVEVSANAVNFLKPVAVDVSELKAFFWLSPADMTVKLNSTSDPDPVELKANVPFFWVLASGLPNPLTADLTALYFTTAADDVTLVQLRFHS